MTMRIATGLLIGLTLTACVSTRDRHGYVMERGETELTAIAGVDTKESVLARFGEPSMRAALTDDKWYYVSSRTNARAFYNTETMSREVVAFNFDPTTGAVLSVDKLNLDDGEQLAINDRVTRTRGKELTFLEQLIGGVGQVAGQVDPDGGTGPGQ